MPAAEPKLQVVSTGTGFVVQAPGHVLTNHHVIEDCRAVAVVNSAQEMVPARVIAADPETDLTLLLAPKLQAAQAAAFRSGRGVRPGDDIVVMGFPLHGVIATYDATVTTGTVSVMSGLRDDRRHMQIAAPMQPGNSGGPVLDAAGNVVGIAVAVLDAVKTAAIEGFMPQNINFAIQAWAGQVFLDANGVDYATAASDKRLGGNADIAAAARPFTHLVLCLD